MKTSCITSLYPKCTKFSSCKSCCRCANSTIQHQELKDSNQRMRRKLDILGVLRNARGVVCVSKASRIELEKIVLVC